MNSILSQRTKENKKFIYVLIMEGARAKEYEIAMLWLMDCAKYTGSTIRGMIDYLAVYHRQIIELTVVQISVEGICSQQFLMGSLFHNGTVFHDQNQIC